MLKRMRPLLGTFVEVVVHAPNLDEINLSENAFQVIEDIHHLMSFQSIDSDISKLNCANQQWINVHPHTIRCLKLAKAMAKASNNLFNPTIAGELVQRNILPNHHFANYLPTGNPTDIDISSHQVRLKAAFLISVDGIAKGYAVDCAIKVLKQLGCTYGWINAGGDIRVFGDYALPIDIHNDKNELIPIGAIQNSAIATSVAKQQPHADFPAFLIAKNLQYGCFSVISNSAWRADALTKVACALPLDKAKEEISRLGGHLIKV